MSRIPRPSPLVRRLLGISSAVVLSVSVAAAYVAPQLSNVHMNIPSYAIPLQGAVAGTVTLDQASAGVVVVALSSSNPQVVGVPARLPMQPGSTSVQFVATGVGAGCAIVTAALGSETSSDYMVVHPASSATAPKLTIPNNLVGAFGSVASSVSVGLRSLESASLSSSNPAIATVPASVALTRGSGSFTITTRGPGCTTITATAAGQTVRRTLYVVDISG